MYRVPARALSELIRPQSKASSVLLVREFQLVAEEVLALLNFLNF